MRYLFQVHIGPVQRFIASARRTRDFWFGSWLLSELAKAAVATLHGRAGHMLIFHLSKRLTQYNLIVR
ncbi:MAG: hypothetical protein HC914_15375 [Chloroflexaceae bacterium]|nr:hypothetical protein [Chloroflexaceae bacterium]